MCLGGRERNIYGGRRRGGIAIMIMWEFDGTLNFAGGLVCEFAASFGFSSMEAGWEIS